MQISFAVSLIFIFKFDAQNLEIQLEGASNGSGGLLELSRMIFDEDQDTKGPTDCRL